MMTIRNPYHKQKKLSNACPEYCKLEDFSVLISDTSRIAKIIEIMEKKRKKLDLIALLRVTNTFFSVDDVRQKIQR